jgi:hypothetical protein
MSVLLPETSGVEADLLDCARCDDGLLGGWSAVCDVEGPLLDGCFCLWSTRQPSSHVIDAPARYAAYRFEVPAYVAPVIMASKMLV